MLTALFLCPYRFDDAVWDKMIASIPAPAPAPETFDQAAMRLLRAPGAALPKPWGSGATTVQKAEPTGTPALDRYRTGRYQ
jgi:hypothetical protein